MVERDPFARYRFSDQIKREIRKQQRGICASCGEKSQKPLQVHHIIPEKHPYWQGKDGKDDIENAIGLDQVCHALWDERAYKEGVFFSKKG